MAAIATAAAGNWSAGGTWTGGVAPGVGDTATVNHAVTVDVNTVVGSAPATGGTAAIAVNAALTVAAGVTLEVQGDVIIANVVMTLAAGASLLVNPATGVNYLITIGTVANQTTTRLTCNGTSASRCTVRKKAGAAGTCQATTAPVARGGKITATFTDFIGLGTATSNGWTWSPTGGEVFIVEDCTIDACGTWGMSVNINNVASIRFKRTRWLNSLDADCLTLAGSTAMTSGERIIERCSFDKNLNFNVVGFLVTESRMKTLSGGASGPDWAAGSQNNIVLSSSAAGNPVTIGHNATISRWYVVRDTATNPHFVTPYASASQTFDQIVLECPNTATTGDGFPLGSPAAAQTYTFTRCYMLPNANGVSPGKLVACLGNANVTFSVTHCTMHCAGNSAEQSVAVGETYAGHAGMLASHQSNIAWCTSGTGYFLTRIGGTVQDIAAAANVDYNAGWGLSAGTDGNGVNATAAPNFFSAGGHQTHGVTLASDPFVDRTRNLAKWGATLGGAGTYADSRDNLFALTPGWNVADLIDYVIAGFQVTDFALRNAGHDGVTIGASPFAEPVPVLLGGLPPLSLIEI